MIKKLFSVLTLLFLFWPKAFSQDVGVTKIFAPTSGCNMGSETVTIEVTNFGSALLLTTIPLKYSLDGGAVVSQNQLFTAFNANSTQTVSFNVGLNLSGNYGKHSLVVYSDFSSDTKRSNDTSFLNFYNYKLSDGGFLLANDTVCSSNNKDTLRLTKKSGDVQHWESNAGSGWNIISNTDSFYIYSNVSNTTAYRVLVKNGLCASDYSDTATIVVGSPAQAGKLGNDTNLCRGEKGQTLKLKGYEGEVRKWQSNEGSGWSDIHHNEDTLDYGSPLKTTQYRVIVAKNICEPDTSNSVTIKITQLTVGGKIFPAADTVCSGNNKGTLTLTSKIGEVKQWESNIGSGWNPVINADTFLNYNNIALSTYFRVWVKSGICPADYSSVAYVAVDQPAKAGILERDRSICAGGKGDTLWLKKYEGKIVKWQSNSGSAWLDIHHTGDRLIYPAPVSNMRYRAIVAKKVCKHDTSNSVSISVISATKGGNILPVNSKACIGKNHDTLVLKQSKGDRSWEFSDDEGFTWQRIVNRDSIQIYHNLMATRRYRVLLEASGCNPVYSGIATVNVLPQPEGGVLEKDKSVCGGSNRDTLVLKKFKGSVVKWQSNNGSGWIDINDTNSFLYVSGIFKTTTYRAIVGNKVCANDTSTTATIKIITTTYGGKIVKSDSVCLGANDNTLRLRGHVGDIRWWERSSDNGINWHPLANTDTVQRYFNLSQTTLYRVLVEGKNCPKDYSDTATISVYKPFVKILSNGPHQFCSGGKVELSATFGYPKYNWNSGQSSQKITVDSSGLYRIIITDKRGCMNSDSVNITVYPLPIADAGKDLAISLGASTRLSGSGGIKYLWRPGASLSDSTMVNPLASPLVTTHYLLKVTDINGCSDTDLVRITVWVDYNLNPKNIITPNGDGINDTWKIDNILPYEESTVTIVNRYGYKVYEKTGYENTWDGSNGGQRVADGTYYYMITFTHSDKVYKGHITVLSK